MCGQALLNAPSGAIAARFGVTTDDQPTQNLRLVPSQMMRVILNVSPQTVSYAKWGFIPNWLKDPKGGNKPINARGEEVATNGYFRSSFKGRRCLVIATSFYEWERDDKGKTGQPYQISLKTGELFAMAGVWDIWQSPDGEVLTFAIVTTEANELVGRIHNRMPVFLHPADEKVWLDTSTPDTSAAKALLRPFPSELMIAEPVSPEIFKRKKPDPKQDPPEPSLFEDE